MLGLPLALVLHHPWSLLPWAVVVGGLLYLGRDLEPLPRDLGIPERSETPPQRREPAPPEPKSPKLEPLVELIDIPAGRFRMGSPEDEKDRDPDEGPQHWVQVPNFRMMRILVTRRLYRAYMNEVPEQWGAADKDGELPANQVNWYDTVRFCNALSATEGLEPCYRIEEQDSVALILNTNGYRLPTEAEWEYACRAGTSTRFFFGSGSLFYFFDNRYQIGKYAWFAENSGHKPHPVAGKKPNPWGLYDMHGNLWEWVEDCWHEDYRGASTDGSAWVDKDCPYRVVRGGSFVDPSGLLRSADRYWVRPLYRFDLFGFRCVRSLSPSMGPSTH